jgi:hypothetical protein
MHLRARCQCPHGPIHECRMQMQRLDPVRAAGWYISLLLKQEGLPVPRASTSAKKFSAVRLFTNGGNLTPASCVDGSRKCFFSHQLMRLQSRLTPPPKSHLPPHAPAAFLPRAPAAFGHRYAASALQSSRQAHFLHCSPPPHSGSHC